MKIEINGINCLAIIGAYDYEREKAQPVIIDLELQLNDSDEQIAYADNLECTVDYFMLTQAIVEYVNNTSFILLESLAKHVSNLILTDYHLVDHVQVTVIKSNLDYTFANKVKVSHSRTRLHRVVVALGSNMNNPLQQIYSAAELLEEYIQDIQLSPIYKSKPAGYTKQEDFHNACLIGDTSLSPSQLLTQIKKTEKLMGKQELFINGPRIIDLDIIFYDNIIYRKNKLVIPHQECHNRDFVLQPLADIAPDWLHPLLGVNVLELKNKLTETYLLERVE